MNGGQLAANSGDTGAIDKLVDEQKVTLEQGVLHAAARDLECLHAKGADDDEERQRDNDDLGPVREKGKLASSPPAVRGTEGVRPVLLVDVHGDRLYQCDQSGVPRYVSI